VCPQREMVSLTSGSCTAQIAIALLCHSPTVNCRSTMMGNTREHQLPVTQIVKSPTRRLLRDKIDIGIRLGPAQVRNVAMSMALIHF
jgi:hypothetical protein